MVIDSYLKRKKDKAPLKARLCCLILTFAWLGLTATTVSAQISSGIMQPANGDSITGVVEVVGTAVHPDYLRYELAFLQQDVPGAEWIVFAEGSQPVTNNVLAVWDTTVGRAIGSPVFPDGRYQLRLRVVKTDFNYDEYFVTNLTIQNDGPTPTPTPDETAVALTATVAANPLQPTGNTENDFQGESSFQQPTPLPSLTPFPTPTPPPTAVGGTPVAPQTGSSGEDGGLIGQLEAVETDRVGVAFWLGIRLTAGFFVAGALYLLLRWVVRRLWHFYWINKSSES